MNKEYIEPESYTANYNGNDEVQTFSNALKLVFKNKKAELFDNGKFCDDMNGLSKGDKISIIVHSDGRTPSLAPLSHATGTATEHVGTMLPIVPLNGVTHKSVIKFITDPDEDYNSLVDESVDDLIINMKTKVNISTKTRKLIIQIYMLKAKIKYAEKKNTDNKKIIDMKRELVQKQKELSAIRKTSDDESKKEITRIEKECEKNITEEEVAEESCNDASNESVITESEDVTTESEAVPADKRINYWTQMIDATKKKILTEDDKNAINILKNKIKEYEKQIESIKEANKPRVMSKGVGLKGKFHSTRLLTASTEDIIDGDEYSESDIIAKLENDNIDLNISKSKAVELFAETGNILYENKIKGLTKRIEENTKKIDSIKSVLNEKVMTEAANMEDEIKPIVQKFEDKGYGVKYASPGHVKLRKKEDREPDGVYYSKLYSDARIVFDKKYKFPKAPKYWYWKDIDEGSYLDVTPISYNENNGTPNEAFKKWKNNYMNSLKEFVDSLDKKEEKVEESYSNTNNDVFDYMSYIYE